jgi:hypothetical protein
VIRFLLPFRTVVALCLALCSLTFLADSLLPLGIAVAPAYLVVVVISGTARSRKLTMTIASLSTVLTLGGIVLSPSGVGLALALTNRGILVAVLWVVAFLLNAAMRLEQEIEYVLADRETALADVKILEGLLPICASCKKIRDRAGRWRQLEEYIARHSEADFTHGICEECAVRLYGEEAVRRQEQPD